MSVTHHRQNPLECISRSQVKRLGSVEDDSHVVFGTKFAGEKWRVVLK
jgi:hypothetical protein